MAKLTTREIEDLLEASKDETPEEVFYFPFACKSGPDSPIEESEYKGIPGLFLEGYCAVFGPRDRGGENWKLDLRPGSQARKAFEAYFRDNPVVLFEHGKDQHVGRKSLGYTVSHKIDDYGVWVRDFIPRPEKNAGVVYDIYQKVKAGVYRTFSIGGFWAKNAQNTIVEVADIFEHSIVSLPMMGHATFTLAKSLDLKANRGIDLEEALTLIASEKRGAMISATNKAKIKQAIETLEDLLGLSDADDSGDTDEAAEAATGGSEGGGAATGGIGLPRNGNGKTLLTTTQDQDQNQDRKATPTTTTTQTQNTNRGGNALTQQESNRQGVKSMSDTNKTGQNGGGEGGNDNAGTVQLTAEQFKAFQAMQEQFEKTAKEAEARKLAEEQVKAEQEAETKRLEAENARKAEIQAIAEEMAKSMRGGSRMNFAGNTDSGSVWASKNFNRNSDKKGFSFIQFAKAGLQNREWQYMEDLKSADPQYKALQESIGSQGGYIVPEQQSTEIEDLLRPQAVVRNMPGVRTMTMSSDTLVMPRLTADATAYWGAEGSTLTTSQPSFGQLRFVARKLYALVQVTKEMLADSNPAVDQIIRESIAAALALKEDDAFLQGSGIGETPLGILNYTNIGTFAYSAGAASAAPEYKALVKAAGIVRNANARPTGVVMHSRIGDQLLSAIDTTGQPIALNAIGGYRWAEVNAANGRTSNDPNATQFGTLLGMTQAFANQLSVSANTSGTGTVVMGDWRRFIIGDRQGIEVEIDRSIGFLSDTVYIKATKRVDCVVTIPQAFCSITGFSAIDVA